MKKNIICTIVAIACFTIVTNAQGFITSNELTASITKETGEATTGESYKVKPANRNPQYPGGMTALTEYLAANTTYSERARLDALEGKVNVKFIVNGDGSLSDFEAIQSPYTELENCALAVIESMPNWEPAIRNGYTVSTPIVVTINFSLK